MSWISMLYQTYENNIDKAGKIENQKQPLTPVAHMIANAQIEITIDEDGNFVSASEVPKENRKTIIPCTETSQARTSKKKPHPLCDKLSYVAGDYENYAVTQKEKSDANENFESYIQGLSKWCDSDYAHQKARAILEYTQKRQTISDLVQSGLVKLNDGKFAKAKIQGTDYESCIVRYRVTSSEDNDISQAVWEDKTLFKAFIDYNFSCLLPKDSKNKEKNEDICFVTGKKALIASIHPKGIIPGNENAKIISANDDEGFTYRGLFYKPEDASTVSYEASQKAHIALKWLLANQGVRYGGRTFICWNPVGKEIPNPLFDFGAKLHGDTEPLFQKKLYNSLQGYKNDLDCNNDDIVIISFDAPGIGRLSITYYNELKASTFLQNYELWCKTVRWKIPDEKRIETVHTLETERIINYAFGHEQDVKLTNDEIKEKKKRGNYDGSKTKREVLADKKLLKEQIQIIINCMINNYEFPYYIAHALAVKASKPLAYSQLNADRILAYACAAIAKYHNQKNEGVVYDMNLDNFNSNRSYLFGRLLAIAEKVEKLAMYNSGSTETRETNAIRLRTAFANHPMHTWRILDEKLDYYYGKLKPQKRAYYRDLSSELLARIADECTTDGVLNQGLLNKRLDDVYLIGYSNQYNDLKFKNDENQEDENQ